MGSAAIEKILNELVLDSDDSSLGVLEKDVTSDVNKPKTKWLAPRVPGLAGSSSPTKSHHGIPAYQAQLPISQA